MNEHPLMKQTRTSLAAISFGIPTAVFKTTRAGASTGLGANCVNDKLKVCMVSSTKRARDIGESAIKYSNDQYAEVRAFLSNHNCPKNVVMLEEFPKLKDIPYLLLPDCSKCSDYGECPITEPITNQDNIAVFSITYDKLVAITFSESQLASDIRDIILNCDVIIFDEIHKLETDVVANSIPVYAPYPGDIVDGLLEFPILARFMYNFVFLGQENNESIREMHEKLQESGKNNDLIAKRIKNPFKMSQHDATKAHSAIVTAIKKDEYHYNKKETANLFNIIQVMVQSDLYLHGIKSSNGIELNFSAHPQAPFAISQFMKLLKPRKHEVKIILVSATFGDMTVYEDVFGEIDSIRMDDVMHTNRMVTVYPDTFMLDSYNIYGSKRKYVVDEVIRLATEHPGIQFVTMRKKEWKYLMYILRGAGLKSKVDYYGSPNMIGVESNDRQVVFVGAPIMPANVYDPGAESVEHSQQKRTQVIHSLFTQALGRFKDPQGVEKTSVYCIGIPQYFIGAVNVWGVNRQVQVPMDETEFRMHTTVTCDDPFEGFIIKSKNSFLRGILHNSYILCNSASKKLVLNNMLDGFIKVRVNDKAVKVNEGMIDGHFNGSPISGYDINKEGFSNVGSITLDDVKQRDTLISYLEDVEMPFMLERVGDKFTFWFFFKGVKSDVVFKLMRHACMMGGVRQRGKGRAEIHPVKSGRDKLGGGLGHYRVLPFATGSKIVHPRKLIPLDEFEIGVITI